MRNPFTPNHVRLIQACYPPSPAILTAASECSPNSQELSRLTYYASNHAAKLAKVGRELEKRAKLETSRARSGNARAKASLLVTLAIFKALGAECRSDISLFTPALISIVASTLSAFQKDLEVAAKAASLFIVWTTYTDGHLVGVDPDLTSDYRSVLKLFANLCRDIVENGDNETRNRRRLIGIAALTGVVTSDALYHAASEFASQVTSVLPGLFYTLQEADHEALKEEVSIVKHQPSASSAFLSEFRPRPLSERRAASIHVHIDGEHGPSSSDVVNASLRAFHILLERINASQVSEVLQAAFEEAEKDHWWKNLEFCRWFAQTTADWTQYQYRYAVPKKLVERLLLVQDTPSPMPIHFALTSMIHAVFTSATPLVNFSTSDIMSSLLLILTRRTSIDSTDALLAPLVDCIAALGTHIYYQDQIHDLAEDLIGRLVSVQVNGFYSRHQTGDDLKREKLILCLLAALRGLFRTADRQESRPNSLTLGVSLSSEYAGNSSSPGRRTLSTERTLQPRRTHVSPEIWQDSLALLCEANYGVRAAYARELLRFLHIEMHEEPFALRPLNLNGAFPSRRATPGSIGVDPTVRFLNALHAAVYALATSSMLGISSSPSASTRSSIQHLPTPAVKIVAATPTHTPEMRTSDVDLEQGSSTASQMEEESVQQITRPRHSLSGHRNRKPSLPLSLLNLGSIHGRSREVTPSDYTYLLHILISLHERLPGRALLTGIPMLLALYAFTTLQSNNDPHGNERRFIILELLGKLWRIIGKVWECNEIITMAEKALSELGTVEILGSPSTPPKELLHPPEEAMGWSDIPTSQNGTPCADLHDVLVPDQLIQALVSNRNVLTVTGLDQQTLLRRLTVEWTLEFALRESVEQSSSHDALRKDGVSPFLKLSPALMHIENLSLQSLARTQYGVGVNDLREALEGRGSMPNLPLSLTRPSSIRTLDQSGSMFLGNHNGLVRSNTQSRVTRGSSANDVRDVLNKLGAGKNKGNSLLKASFPVLQNTQARYVLPMPQLARFDATNRSKTSLIPPYPS